MKPFITPLALIAIIILSSAMNIAIHHCSLSTFGRVLILRTIENHRITEAMISVIFAVCRDFYKIPWFAVILLISPNSSIFAQYKLQVCNLNEWMGKTQSTKLILSTNSVASYMCNHWSTFWFSSRNRFPKLFELVIRYLSVPCNSVDAERSVSQYTLVSAPQRQNSTDQNLSLHAMMVFSARC